MPLPPRAVLVLAALAAACAGVPREAGREPLAGGASGSSAPTRAASGRAYAHYLRARLAEAEGDTRGAMEELKLALVFDEESPELRVSYAEALARLGKLDRAEAEARRAIELAPSADAAAEAHLLLGKIHLARGQAERARAELTAATALQSRRRDRGGARARPLDGEAWRLLGELELRSGNDAAAQRVYEELAALSPGESTGLREMGRLYLERRDLARAEELLRKAIDVNAADVDAWRKLAEVHGARNDRDGARRDWEAVLRLDGEDEDALLALGKLSLATRDEPAARAYLDRLLRVAGDEIGTRVGIAFAWLEAHRPGDALDAVRGAEPGARDDGRLRFVEGLVLQEQRRWADAAVAFAAVGRDDGDLWTSARMNLAYCLSHGGRHEEARRALEPALSDRPSDARLVTMLAYVLERGGKASKAVEVLRRALDERERDGVREGTSEMYEALASGLTRTGRGADAVALLERALQARPDDPVLLYALGTAEEKLGRVEAGVARMQRLLELDPQHADALNFIGYTWAERGERLDEAEALVSRAVELRPESGFILDSLGWVLLKKGEVARALRTLERALELAGPDPTILEHLGEAYRAAQRPNDAASAFRRALKSFDPALAQEDAVQRAGIERKLRELGTAIEIRPASR